MKNKAGDFKSFWAMVEFSGIGGFQEKFISELLDDNTYIDKISYDKGILTAYCKPHEYLYISRKAKRHGIKLKVKKRHGFVYKLYSYRNRWGLAIGGLSCCAVILILSQFIWDIRINGNSEVTDLQLLNLLQENGAMVGALTDSFCTKTCELKAMSQISELSWISVEKEGSRIYVKAAEEPLKSNEISYDTPCNIISDVDGQIVSAYIKRGTFMSEKGSGIHKGQLLVSGAVDDNGGHTIFVHANADIRARYTQTEEFFLPFSQTRDVPTEKEYTLKYLMLGGYSLPLPMNENPENSDNRLQYSEETKQLSLFDIKLPLYVKTGTYTEYKSESIIYTEADVKNQLTKQASLFEENLLSECDIIKKSENYIPVDEGIILKIEYTLERNIGVKQPIKLFY